MINYSLNGLGLFLHKKDMDGFVSFSLKISNPPICPLYRSKETKILKQMDIYKIIVRLKCFINFLALTGAHERIMAVRSSGCSKLA